MPAAITMWRIGILGVGKTARNFIRSPRGRAAGNAQMGT
jgi:hypothetical protein